MTGAAAAAGGLPSITASWADISGPSGLPTDTNADVVMTASGTLKATFTGTPSAVSVFINASPTTISSGDSFAVAVGDSVHFAVVKFSAGSGVFTITNVTLGDTLVDTFNWEQT